MIRTLHVWLWGIVMELEDALYPWKTSEPPPWAIEKHSLPTDYDDELDEIIHKEWIKAHEEKISRLQSEMIYISEEVRKLRDGNQTGN